MFEGGRNDIERAINLHKDLLDMAEYNRATYEDFCGTADLTKEQRKRVYDDMDKNINMHKAVISALEKQMPKKVKWTPAYQSYISAGDEAEPFCPECGELLEDDQPICLDCYQVIDWRVEE